MTWSAVFRCHYTKPLLALCALIGLLALKPSIANAVNVLQNPNLDQIGLANQLNATPISWTVFGRKSVSGDFFDGGDSETFCNVSPPSDPSGYGFFFKPFQGSIGPPADLLSVALYQDNPATPGTKFTLSGYAAGEANYSGFFATNSPAPSTIFMIVFLGNSGNVISSNAFNLITAGLPNGGPSAMSSFNYTTPQVTAPAGTVTVRAGAAIYNVYSTQGAQSFFVDSFDLESTAPAGSPVITNQPVQVSVPLGGTAHFNVGVSNTSGATYQWQHASTNISDGGEYSGTATANLTVTGVTAPDVGHYRLLVSNASGSTFSSDGILTITEIHIYPTISITGKVGDTYRIDYATAVAPSNWIPLSTNKLSSSPQLFNDTSFPQDKARFYRSVFLY